MSKNQKENSKMFEILNLKKQKHKSKFANKFDLDSEETTDSNKHKNTIRWSCLENRNFF